MPKSSMPLLEGLDVCHPRYSIYLFFPSLEVTPEVPIALHLPIARDDDITRQLVICNNNYNFYVYPYSILQKFTVDSKVIVTSHPKIVRKSRAWHTDFSRVLRRLTLTTD